MFIKDRESNTETAFNVSEWVQLDIYKASSGNVTFTDATMTTIRDDYRNEKFQKDEDEGPLPEGPYRLKLTPKGMTQFASNGNTIPGTGWQQMPTFRSSTGEIRPVYYLWGTQRIPLIADPGTNLHGGDGNFYCHDSHKGFTHGCVELEAKFFVAMKAFVPLGSLRIKI